MSYHQPKWKLTHPIFSAPERFWKATPATLLAMIAGPPLFPGLMAASIWIAISWVAPCTYCVGSTLETTPLVTEMLSPPAINLHYVVNVVD